VINLYFLSIYIVTYLHINDYDIYDNDISDYDNDISNDIMYYTILYVDIGHIENKLSILVYS